MQKLARLAIQRRWLVIGAWLAFIVLAQGISGALGGANYKDTFSLPHTETASVAKVLKNAGLDSQNGATGTVVLKAKTGTLQSAPAGLAPALDKLCTSGNQVSTIRTPWQAIDCTKAGATTAGDPKLLNTAKGSTTGLVNITWTSNHYDQKLFTNVFNELKNLRSDALQVEFTGNAFQNIGQSNGGVPPFAFGFIAALIILLIVFRTVAATALPLASAVAALGAGLGLIGILTHAMNVSNITPQLTELMVLGVGVDYALFIVTRHRRNLRRGMSVPDSIIASINTSGRAVLFAGSTVCIAILGLIALGVSFFNGMAIGAAVAVGLTMAASLTLLPALLSLLGLKVLPRKQRRAVRAGQFIDVHPTGFWARWSRLVAAHKIALGLAGTAVIVAMAVPFFSLRLGQGDQGNDPSSTTTRKGYDLIAKGFGVGYNSNLEAVIDGPGATDPAYLQTVGQTLANTPGVDPASVHPIPLNNSGRARVVQVDRLAPGCEDLFPGQAPALQHLAAGLRRNGEPHLRLRRHRDPGRLREGALGQDAAVHRGGRRVVVPALVDRVPQRGRAAHRCGDEPVRGRRVVRHCRGDLPVGLGLGGARRRQGWPDRCLGTGHVLRDPVRIVDGLPGVPGQPNT